MTGESPPYDKKRPAVYAQTDMRVHQAWAKLCVKKPRAAAVMHQLVALLPRNQQAVVVSQATLGKMLGCHSRTVKRALNDLAEAQYIQIVSLGKGSVSAYVINKVVAWTGSRDKMMYANFSAQVIADSDDQAEDTMNAINLNEVPMITPPDMEIQSGEQGFGQMVIEGTAPSISTMPDDQDND